jgi:hypothetical protein
MIPAGERTKMLAVRLCGEAIAAQQNLIDAAEQENAFSPTRGRTAHAGL